MVVPAKAKPRTHALSGAEPCSSSQKIISTPAAPKNSPNTASHSMPKNLNPPHSSVAGIKYQSHSVFSFTVKESFIMAKWLFVPAAVVCHNGLLN